MLKVHTATKFSLNAVRNDARVVYKNPLGGDCGNQCRKEPNNNQYSTVKTVKPIRGLSVYKEGTAVAGLNPAFFGSVL